MSLDSDIEIEGNLKARNSFLFFGILPAPHGKNTNKTKILVLARQDYRTLERSNRNESLALLHSAHRSFTPAEQYFDALCRMDCENHLGQTVLNEVQNTK